jgi:2-keto-3-deoxy-L-rhamnonate aldolase RhmA
MINLCERARSRVPSYGIYIALNDPAVIEMAKKAGFDFARLDAEHTRFNADVLKEMFRTARLLDFPLQIRLASAAELSTVLCMEPDAVMIPHVETAEAARAFAEESKFYPLGQRGMYSYVPSVRYGGMSMRAYMEYANAHMHTIVQIESIRGLSNVEEIASVPGIDMLATGKMDLSQSLGIPCMSQDTRVIEAENKVIEAALRHEKTPVVLAKTPERIKELEQKGVYCFLLGFDDALCLESLKDCMSAFR